MRNRSDKPLAIRNGLKIYTKLKAKTPMKVITPKQRKKNQTWSEITKAKIATLGGICQWCEKSESPIPFDFLSGHHVIKRRYNVHTRENCYIAHYFQCHLFIENHSIDVLIYPSLKAWEAAGGH